MEVLVDAESVAKGANELLVAVTVWLKAPGPFITALKPAFVCVAPPKLLYLAPN